MEAAFEVLIALPSSSSESSSLESPSSDLTSSGEVMVAEKEEMESAWDDFAEQCRLIADSDLGPRRS